MVPRSAGPLPREVGVAGGSAPSPVRVAVRRGASLSSPPASVGPVRARQESPHEGGGLYGMRDLRVEDLADPAPGPGEALIRIEASGVCPSDIRSYTGARAGNGALSLPRTPGHEWAGVVLEVRPDEAARPRRVGDGEHGAGAPERSGPATGSWRTGATSAGGATSVAGGCSTTARACGGRCAGASPSWASPRSPSCSGSRTGLVRAAAFSEPLACVVNAERDDADGAGERRGGRRRRADRPAAPQLASARGARVIVADPLAARLATARELGAHDVVDAVRRGTGGAGHGR